MKLNQRVRYGVGCLFELSQRPGEYIDGETVAKRQNIPPAYAHKVLQNLARAGLIYAHRGLGYKLARPLSDITANEVIDVLTKDVDAESSNPDLGVLLEARINKVLEGITLGEVANQ